MNRKAFLMGMAFGVLLAVGWAIELVRQDAAISKYLFKQKGN